MFFARPILAAVALLAASAHAQLTITDPSPSLWWVANAVNNLAWTCNAVPSSETFTVVLSSSDSSILVSPLALIANVPNYRCSLSVSAQLSDRTPSTTYTLSLVNAQNLTDVYTSTPFELKAANSPYPASTSGASGSATGTASGASATSTSASKTGGAVVRYVPAGMGVGVAAALVLGLVVA